MDFDKLVTPSEVKKFINEYGFRFKKRLGQNFLIDRNILHKIVMAAELTPEHFVIEIGTGLGTLTTALAKKCAQVITFEVDRDLIEILSEQMQLPNVHLVATDALKADWVKVLREHGWINEPVSVVANLPYYLTSPLVMKALEESVPFKHIVVMVQKEVADRMQAESGTKDYGVLTLAIRYYAEVEVVTKVPRTVFMPIPDVDSAVVKLTPRPPQTDIDHELLFQVIRAGFGQRRKTLRNALKSLCHAWGINSEQLEQVFIELQLPQDIRGEVLSLTEFVTLTSRLIALKN